MMFSKACEYGIRAAVYVAKMSSQKQRVSLKAITEAIASPEAFTAKVLQQLVRSKILISVMGSKGGFELAEKDIRLNRIVDAIDGDAIYKGCGLGLKDCNAQKPCSLHDKFLVIREELRNMLEQTTLCELAADVDGGNAFLKRMD